MLGTGYWSAVCCTNQTSNYRRGSLEAAFDKYSNSCTCPCQYDHNCAHYLSNALILGGFEELHGGNSKSCYHGSSSHMLVCQTGRPIRAKELRKWFYERYRKSTHPHVGVNFVYQERARDGQGHVLLKKYNQNGEFESYRGTGDYPGWAIQEYFITHSN